jgi:hypothetical protein
MFTGVTVSNLGCLSYLINLSLVAIKDTDRHDVSAVATKRGQTHTAKGQNLPRESRIDDAWAPSEYNYDLLYKKITALRYCRGLYQQRRVLYDTKHLVRV